MKKFFFILLFHGLPFNLISVDAQDKDFKESSEREYFILFNDSFFLNLPNLRIYLQSKHALNRELVSDPAKKIILKKDTALMIFEVSSSTSFNLRIDPNTSYEVVYSDIQPEGFNEWIGSSHLFYKEIKN